MSGQNKRISNDIIEVNRIIEEYKLNYIEPIYFLDDSGNRIDNIKKSVYDNVIMKVSELIGELRGLSLPSSNRTPEKQEKYKHDMELLVRIRNNMKEKRNSNQ